MENNHDLESQIKEYLKQEGIEKLSDQEVVKRCAKLPDY